MRTRNIVIAICVAVLAAPMVHAGPRRVRQALKVTRSQWDTDHAAHLLRRAGFGGRPEEIEHLTGLGREGAVEYLLNYDEIAFPFESPGGLQRRAPLRRMVRDAEKEELQAIRKYQRRNAAVQFDNLSQWWLRRMIATPRPLEERMVLFWHGHFTSGMREVRDPFMMYEQNEMFRRLAVSDLRSLVMAVTADPAMLQYLDSAKNVASKPNENFARELMELFTMGEGNYTEWDVKEAARAFTGWSIDPYTGQFTFRPKQHDYGVKEVLGRSGPLQGMDIVDIILSDRAAGRHIARKLWIYFTGTEPTRKLERALASGLRSSDYDIKRLLKRIFMSDAFYAPEVRYQRVKSPVEYLVGSMRLLELDAVDGAAASRALVRMGQQLFQPPNVKGWDGGVRWINASTLTARYDTARGLMYGTRAQGRQAADVPEIDDSMIRAALRPAQPAVIGDQPAYNPTPVLAAHKLDTAEKIVDHFVLLLVQRPLEPGDRALLIEHVRVMGGSLEPDDDKTVKAVRGLIHLILSLPEYQLS